jgi:hypothetical protein
MDDKVSISYEEIVQELGALNPTLVELAVERVKSRKLAEALQAATADVAEEQPDESPVKDE